MEETNVPIFAQAKIEYTNQLVDILYPHMYDGIKSIYDESKLIYRKKNLPIFILFRELLEKVPIWNGEIIDSECSRITSNSNCDWLDDLITAVFISHTKILTSIGPNQNFTKINVTIPKTINFIHKTYINIARELWKNPYLFNENIPGHEYQRNSKEIENIIKQCIEATIRKLLPVKEILKEHLETYDSDNSINKDDLRSLLKEQIGSLKNELLSDKANGGDEGGANNDGANNDGANNDGANNDGANNENNENNENNTNYEENNYESKEQNQTLDELNNIIDKLKTDVKNNIENENNYEILPNEGEEYDNSPFREPTETDIIKNTSDIVVNDITIPVDVPQENYDNTELFTDDNNKSNIENFIENIKPVTINETPENSSFINNNVLNNPDVEVTKIETQNNHSFFTTDDSIGNEPIQLDSAVTDNKTINPNDQPLNLDHVPENKDENILFKPEKETTNPEEPLFKPENEEPLFKPEKETTNSEEPLFKPEKEEPLFQPEKEEPLFQPEKEEPLFKPEKEEPLFQPDDKNKIDFLPEVLEENNKKDIVKENKSVIELDNEIDETSSLANFFEDMKQISSDKNLTLFDDAKEV